MDSESYCSPARVGLETVRSSSSLPSARSSRWTWVKRLGVSFQSVRRENMQQHDTGLGVPRPRLSRFWERHGGYRSGYSGGPTDELRGITKNLLTSSLEKFPHCLCKEPETRTRFRPHRRRIMGRFSLYGQSYPIRTSPGSAHVATWYGDRL